MRVRSPILTRVIASAMLPLPFLAQGQQTGSPAGNAQAEDAEEAVVSEITVTARRRDETLLEVPISLVTRSGEYLEQARVDSIAELSRLVPGFVFKEFEAGGASTMGIRGLSTFSNQVAAQQSVGVLIDDVVLDTIGQVVTEFNDIQRIEVLRGPQGTLFGRNTTGGVVHIVTNDPVNRFEGKASVSYGSYDEVKWNGTLNLPLGENLAARASVFTINREGHIENIHEGRMLGADRQVGVHGKLLYTPSANTSLKLSLTYAERDQESLSSFGGQPVVAFGPAADPDSTAVQLNQDIVGPENDKVIGVGYHPFEDQIAGVSLTWNQALGDFELTSITAFEYWQWYFGKGNRTFNAPVEPVAIVRPYAATELEGWSQEVRLSSPSGGRMEYVAGAFVSGSKYDDDLDFLFNVSGDPDPAGGIYLFTQENTKRDILTYALFGEADFHLTETLTFTAGVRWTHDEMDVAVNSVPAPGFIPEFGIGIGPLGELYIPFLNSEFPGFREDSVSASDWNWRGGLRWEPRSDLMLYGTVARGYKGPTISALGAFSIVQPEIATNYEVGVKAGFLDNRVLTNLTVFYTDVEDFQAEKQNNIETPQGTSVQIVLTNAGKVRSRGVEFELSAAPTEKLRFDLGLAYVDAEYVSYPGASCFEGQTEAEGCVPLDPTDPDSLLIQDLSGKRLPRTPEWSGSASVNYDFEVPFWSLRNFVRLDYTYQSEINWSLGLAPLNEAGSQGVVGLTLGLRSPDERLEVLGYVKNLTDEYVVNGLIGGHEVIRAELLPEYKRTYGIALNYRFQ